MMGHMHNGDLVGTMGALHMAAPNSKEKSPVLAEVFAAKKRERCPARAAQLEPLRQFS